MRNVVIHIEDLKTLFFGYEWGFTSLHHHFPRIPWQTFRHHRKHFEERIEIYHL